MSQEVKMVTFEINGRELRAPAGSMLIKAADEAGIYIPRFCYHPQLSVAANCRMCLVEVEKAPKPLPACATPVAEGMKVFTRSERAVEAQRGTMEFLLINHPLDCPICDQGGECDLQDLAVGYGADASRYAEDKRVVPDKNLGPLISTDMTRCIHCTRCVRFGQELGGVMEMGGTGRGEHVRIGTWVEHSIDSELSGNMIDLCPVGALTSKPFRFSARSWELKNSPAVMAHDAAGSCVYLQSESGRVRRVLPRENESINQLWLSDRDRFSYESLDSPDRLVEPQLRDGGGWRAASWQHALDAAVDGLRGVIERHGADALGALVAPGATTEEMYLVQQLVRGLGSPHVDHRLRQVDFRADDAAPAYPALGRSIASLEELRACLLVGCNLRKEQPILALRVRKSARAGARVMAINPVDFDQAMPMGECVTVAPSAIGRTLAKIAAALCERRGRPLPETVRDWLRASRPGSAEQAIADELAGAGDAGAIVLGALAAGSPDYAALHALAQLVAELSGATLGVLAQGNAAGAWLAGCVPHRGPGGAPVARKGLHARAMLDAPLKGVVLFGVEAPLDFCDAPQAARALSRAEFVLSLSPFASAAHYAAHVALPLAAFSETAGSFVNCEGRSQSFEAAVAPAGEARPGWKILRVLGERLGVPGFEFTSLEQVRARLPVAPGANARLADWQLPERATAAAASEIDLECVVEVPLYRVDSYVRRAPALQATADNAPPSARIHPEQAQRLGLTRGGGVRVHVGEGIASLPLALDARVPEGCVWLPGACAETITLGTGAFARVVRR